MTIRTVTVRLSDAQLDAFGAAVMIGRDVMAESGVVNPETLNALDNGWHAIRDAWNSRAMDPQRRNG